MTTLQKRRRGFAGRAGFTLVELLVALGLVSLMMMLFAEVFQIATGTMTTQRGVMENDQRARAVSTIITNDLRNRSMRTVMPFQPGEIDYPAGSQYSFSQRQGFLSISENDPNNDADDVLHFTTRISAHFSGETASRDELYYGRATALNFNDFNQPDLDNGMLGDSTATSNAAEIVYFLRNGNLYRRVLLIREPLSEAYDAQPKSGPTGQGLDLFDLVNNPAAYAAGNDFWRDFDFSARFQIDASNNPLGARFVGGGLPGLNPLDNGSGGGLFAIGSPLNRFGHNPLLIASHAHGTGVTASVGYPREYVGSLFIGRFTHEETSHEDFNYPHSRCAYGMIGVPTDPFDTPAGTFTDTLPPYGTIDQFQGGPRRGEDILLSNVHGFDVKVWDELIGDYVDVGHSLTDAGGNANGDFNQIQNLRSSYGPQPAGNRMFDTWHPQFDANNTRFYAFYRDQNGDYVVDSTGNPVQAPSIDTGDMSPFALRKNLPPYPPRWQPNRFYNVGDIVIPSNAPGHYWSPFFSYRCTIAGTSGSSEPFWPAISNFNFYEQDVSTSNYPLWTAVYDPKGVDFIKRLRSLKITIRYLDVSSDQMRQVTLIKSLMD
jgi:prepilin-type N-terminal cleavage/methylation domain-containing protein